MAKLHEPLLCLPRRRDLAAYDKIALTRGGFGLSSLDMDNMLANGVLFLRWTRRGTARMF